MSESTSEHLDPRVARSRSKVLSAAVELLREHGAAGLTVEGVAARSGVAKTTIYRHFADRDAIHIAAAESLTEPIAATASDDLVADVQAVLGALADRLRDGDFAAVLATCIDAGERSQRMAALGVALCEARGNWLQQRLRAAVEQGELGADQDPEILASQLAGAMFFRRLISRRPIGDDFVTALTTTVLRTAAPPVVRVARARNRAPATPACTTDSDGAAATRTGP